MADGRPPFDWAKCPSTARRQAAGPGVGQRRRKTKPHHVGMAILAAMATAEGALGFLERIAALIA